MAKKRILYGQIAALVGLLTNEMRSGALVWKDEGPLGLFKVQRDGVEYILDNPRDGRMELLIDGVSVWRGGELLVVLREHIIAQQKRPHLSPQTIHAEPQIRSALRKALATFKSRT